jgi:hypothetical protein
VGFRVHDEGDTVTPGVHVRLHAFIQERMPDWDRRLIVPLWVAFVPAVVGTASLVVAERLRIHHTVDQDRIVMPAKKITINRAPVLTLWASVGAESRRAGSVDRSPPVAGNPRGPAFGQKVSRNAAIIRRASLRAASMTSLS